MSGIWVWGVSAAVVFCVGLLVSALRSRFVYVTIRGRSMEPGYHDGDRVLVRRTAGLEVGQVIVLEAPIDGTWGKPPLSSGDRVEERVWIIKRVVALPGDPVPRQKIPALARAAESRVPAGSLVVLGDNPEASFDSRKFGYFPISRVLGVVIGHHRG
ncbi:S26 family signal peptidase [Thermostaphylospora chromogena]|jgi:signal peptidase I|uniref:Signal peptidase I n=1 Tax=Thermostaphylospora chromogena TaxID=35622 RepID=A0A1H1D5E1_9ACTN|nr:S26 family signal peptidase [Thermostaphylospora chromogena]SDQ71046.1 signal peptidase I [Thermostaphylospora chromogena]